MIEESSASTRYDITAQSLRAPWLSRSLRQLFKQRRAVPSRRLGSALAGAGMAALIHAVLLGTVLYGGAAATKAKRASQGGIGSTQIVSAVDPVMTLILMNDTASTRVGAESEDIVASRGVTKKDLAILMANPDPVLAMDTPTIEPTPDTPAPEAASAADRAARAALYLRYTGQIQARIERAWMRPRSQLGADRFECQVQILQDRLGNVMQTTLQHCNGTADWQMSLVQGIQSASPLPAPPTPEVFADALTLTFASAPLQPGAEEGFEPERRVAQARTILMSQP